MLIAIEPSQVFEFVPASQRNDPEPATFVCRPLTTVDRVELSTLTAGQDQPGSAGGALAVAIVRRALVGWKNIRAKAADGALVDAQLERDWSGVTRACLARIRDDLILELAGELLRREQVTRDELGKS